MTSPFVQYDYANGSANTVRPTGIKYPDGRELSFGYGAADGMSDALSRMASIIDDDTHLVDYNYLGLGAFVISDYAEPEVKWTLVDLTNSNDPDTGDIYSGLDRFGRVKDCRWRNYGSSSDAVRVKNDYDRASNRLWREDSVAQSNSAAFDELYSYDGLHRLQTMQRGVLNGGHTAITGQTFGQCWNLDATSNWTGMNQADGGSSWTLRQSRTANMVNEITDITNTLGSAWSEPAYDPAGNMTTVPQLADPTKSYTATYDAWNRLVKLIDDDTEYTVAEYAYDALDRRIVQKSYVDGDLGETRHLFLSPGWQTIEERIDSDDDPDKQYVWGLRYIDELVLRDTKSDGNLDERHYAIQDGNWNVVAIIDEAGVVQERYAYQCYGVTAVLAPNFMNRGASDFGWETTYCGYRWDVEIGLFSVRHRYYQPALGVWLQRDWLASANLYAYGSATGSMLNPLNSVDPSGLGLIAIDGTSTRDWLTNPRNPQRLPNGRWLSHVRNFYRDYAGPKYYWYGPDDAAFASDIVDIINAAYRRACEFCCAGEPIDMVGWSRGGLAVNEVARLLKERGCCCPGTSRRRPVLVRFLGLYDGVDMTPYAGTMQNLIPNNVRNAVAAYGEERPSYRGVDRDSGMPWNRWPRMNGGPEAPAPGMSTTYTPLPTNCTHGGIGGCPGYSNDMPDGYNYHLDRDNGLGVDMEMRNKASAAGVPINTMTHPEYGYPGSMTSLPPVL